jgi:integrase/recombinase XerD
MTIATSLPALIERFFTQRLTHQRNASPHTIASYRDTFRLLFMFAQKALHKPPSNLDLSDFEAPFIIAFLEDLEANWRASINTRNLRLSAVRTFFSFVAFEEPAYSAQIQRVLAIPGKLSAKREVHFLSRTEIEAIIAASDTTAWLGRRDYTLLLLAIQTGLRLSELTSLDRDSVTLNAGAHVFCTGKSRKERSTPLTSHARRTLKAWLNEPVRCGATALFPTIRGGRLSPDAVQFLLAKYVKSARQQCPFLRLKQITPHVLRHTAAMELLQAGVDISVIALWLGHESIQTTHTYLHSHIALKIAALAKLKPLESRAKARFEPQDKLLAFLNAL